MNTGSVLYEPSLSPAILSRPSSAMHDDHSMGRLHSQYNNYSTPPPHNPSRPPANGRHSYSHQPFPLNPSPRHFLYPPYAQSPPPPISLRSTARHPPPPMLDDPAFSSDPRANPHFAMTIGEQIIPLNSPAANLQNASPLPQDTLYRHSLEGSTRAHDANSRNAPNPPAPYQPFAQKITSSTPPRLQPRVEPLYIPDDAFSSPPAFQQPPVSMAKLKRHQAYLKRDPPPLPPYEPYVNDNSSNSSCSSSSHSSGSSVLLTPTSSTASLPKPRSRLRVVNPEEDDRSIAVTLPPEYYSKPADAINGDRPPVLANTSAPELRPPPAPATDVPPRPATVPVPPLPGSTLNANLTTSADMNAAANNHPVAPEMRRQRSRKTSVAAPPKDLDRIDELDETDPLGYAWHHDGRYEAALQAIKNGALSEGIGAGVGAGGGKAMNQDGKKSSQRNPSAPVDPSTTSFNVSPGEIFPSFNAQPKPPKSKQQQFPTPIQRPSRQGPLYNQQQSLGAPPAQSVPFPQPHLHSQSQVQSQSQFRVQDAVLQPIPSSLNPGGLNTAPRDTNSSGVSQPLSQQIPSQQQRRNSSFLTVLQTNAEDDSELAYTLPSPSRSPMPNPYEQQASQPIPQQSSRLRRHKVPVTEPAPGFDSEQKNLASGMMPPSRVRFQDQADYENFGPVASQQDPRYPPRRMPSPQPPNNQPFLRPQDEVNRNSALYRSSSAPNAPPAAHIPPPGPRPQQYPSQEYPDTQPQQAPIPRPDIILPPRHAPKQGPAPHYLPKKLVMPTPLQPQQPTFPPTRPPGTGMYGESTSTTNSGSSGNSTNAPGNEFGRGHGHSQSLSVSAVAAPAQQKKAKEIPISQGRNVLRKRTTVAGPAIAPIAPPVSAGPLGAGVGSEGYVPSSNATAALFASKVSVGPPAAPVGADAWDGKKIREKEKEDKFREKERIREIERQREKEKPTGRKLSKRR
ncbi:unnamed protein product [Somion occarium]